MKNLLKRLSPFAPDQSGAAAVFFELGGIVVICDAGGCTGNICGFDEPRWLKTRSAVFSAGLRDMDAILGRDDKLIEKLYNASNGSGAAFTAIIGTPVPTIIATDFNALKRMAEKKTGLPCMAIEANGAELYDIGEEKALIALFDEFAKEKYAVKKGKAGVLGAAPLEISLTEPKPLCDRLYNDYRYNFRKIVCYGMGSGLDEIKCASEVEKNIVVAPAALKTAEMLKRKFGTPYEVACPVLNDEITGVCGEKILVIHQQVIANEVRNMLEGKNITVASFFMMKGELARDGDFHIADEECLAEKVEKGGYDVIIGDIKLKRALNDYKGGFVDLPHFAVSGRLAE